MMIKSDRKKEVELIVEAEQQGWEDVFLMEGDIIKMVKQFKYLGTEAESKGTTDAEVK